MSSADVRVNFQVYGDTPTGPGAVTLRGNFSQLPTEIYALLQQAELDAQTQAAEQISGGRVLYVSTQGKDSNDGTVPGRAFRTIGAALARLRAMKQRQWAVKVFPGRYVESGNLEIPENCSVVSDGGQFVTDIFAAPGAENTNMFLVNSGSYVQGFAFHNLQLDSFENPTVGFAIAFAPGATIRRSPYIRDISQVSNYHPDSISAPLDPANGNPAVGKGGGVILADRSVLNPNSVYPYILAFGATPRTPNGIGYCAKNGAGINGISSLSIFSRCAFYALNGGQITLNNSGTQFGDISMRAKGSMPVVRPAEPASPVIAHPALSQWLRANTDSVVDALWLHLKGNTGLNTNSAMMIQLPPLASQHQAHPAMEAALLSFRDVLINSTWSRLVAEYPGSYAAGTFNPTTEVQALTRKDLGLLISALAADAGTGSNIFTQGFATGLFNRYGSPVFASGMKTAFLLSYDILQDEIVSNTLSNSSLAVTGHALILALMDQLRNAINDPASYQVSRPVVVDKSFVFTADPQDAGALRNQRANALNAVWDRYVANELSEAGTALHQDPLMAALMQRDAEWLFRALCADLLNGRSVFTGIFAEGLYGRTAAWVFKPQYLEAFLLYFRYLEEWFIEAAFESNHDHLRSLFALLRNALLSPDYGFTTHERFTRRDAADLLRALAYDIESGSQQSVQSFALGLFDYRANYVFNPALLPDFVNAWEYIRNHVIAEFGSDPHNNLTTLTNVLIDTVQTPDRIEFGSLIESLGHQFNNAGAGVNKNALPLNFRRPGQNLTVPFTVVEENGGRVRWSGSDEFNNQYFAGGTQINGFTGRFEGRPFNSAVRQIARRVATTRGAF